MRVKEGRLEDVLPLTALLCVSGFGFQVSDFGFWVSGSGPRVLGFEFRGRDFGVRALSRPARTAFATAVRCLRLGAHIAGFRSWDRRLHRSIRGSRPFYDMDRE
jgi:hypothetical protein